MEELVFHLYCFRISDNKVETLQTKFISTLIKRPSWCPEEYLEDYLLFEKNYEYIYFFHFRRKKDRNLAERFRFDCQNCVLSVKRTNLKVFLQTPRNIFSEICRVVATKLFGVLAKKFSAVLI